MRDDSGKLLGIETIDVDQEFNEIPGTERFWEADLIFLSMGFLGPEQYVFEDLDLALDQRSNIEQITVVFKLRTKRFLLPATVAGVNR